MLKAAQPPRSNVLMNLVVLYAAQGITSLLSLLPIVFLPTLLGVTGMGKLTLAVSWSGVFSALILAGTATFIVREIARQPERLQEVLVNGVALRLALALVLLPVCVGLVWALGYPADTRDVVILMYVAVAVRMVGQTFAAALQAIENMRWRSAAAVAKEVVAVLVGWLVLMRGYGLWGYVAVLVAADAVEALVNLAYFIWVLPVKPMLRPRLMVAIFRGGVPFFLWAFLQTIYTQSSSLMLSRLGGETAVGWFGTAAQFILPLLMVPSVAITVLLPRFSRLHAVDPGSLRASVARSTNYMLILIMPLAFGLAATADRVIDLFGYPATFDNSIPVLRLLAFLIPATALLMLTATTVSATNKERQWARISLFSVVAVVALNALLIPLTDRWFANAAIGAAAADLVAELLTLVLTLRLIGRRLLDASIAVTAAKTMLAGTLMAAAVMALPPLPLPVVVAVGAIVYVAVALVIRLVPADDLAMFRQLVQRRFGRA